MSMCSCHPEVRNVQTIMPSPGVGASPVVLMICDCDRRTCPVNGCHAKVDPINGAVCRRGHKS